ncbi:hypothetical protein P4O66_004105 [Electrophorus voltai]|uniref:Endonuclease/exonuclease/phosphatase domain-containing protein n=1 Tax=Electrophorus voltai TaxID=2609070 RepID=A0AAD8ZRL6_9TELE|nr:hypothetical protein P4O66_004105 [Electrophorus voltai]
MDTTADSGKSRGNNTNVVTLACYSCNLELLTLKFHPIYLPWEFTSVIVNTVYIPLQANMDTALCELHEALKQFQVQHQDTALIVVGDFNSANLKRAVPNLYQHVTFPTRGKRTLDHCYTPYKDSYKALAHPPFVAISGNMDEYKSAAYGVRRAVREAKRRYGRKLETQFQQSGSRSLW